MSTTSERAVVLLWCDCFLLLLFRVVLIVCVGFGRGLLERQFVLFVLFGFMGLGVESCVFVTKHQYFL